MGITGLMASNYTQECNIMEELLRDYQCWLVIANCMIQLQEHLIRPESDYIIVGLVATAIGPNNSKKLTRLTSSHTTHGKVGINSCMEFELLYSEPPSNIFQGAITLTVGRPVVQFNEWAHYVCSAFILCDLLA